MPPMALFYPRTPVIQPPRSESTISQDIPEDGRQEYMDEIDIHVESALHGRDKLRRTATEMWSFLRTPIGIITAIYGFCVVFWAAAILFFLAGWIPTSSKDRRGFWVEVSSQVENALVAITGIGLVPWRVMDTYRVLRIWNYKRISRKLRKKAGLLGLYDEAGRPDPSLDTDYVHVLADKQQKDLHYQQTEFAKSYAWYKPHGTVTHREFPIWTALLICLFIDGNSIFQAMLCGCMWGLNRFQRPAWTIGDILISFLMGGLSTLTTYSGTLVPASSLCSVTAAILIWRGSQKTKRTQAAEAKLRARLSDGNTTEVPAATLAAASQPSLTL